jgi:flagellar assembly protein FliH
VVESDLGQVDARIAARWRQAAAVLGSELPWDDGDAEPSS